jgi:hypothetical protein
LIPFDRRGLDDLPFLGALGFAALGVAASVLIPVLRAAVPKTRALGLQAQGSSWWPTAKPYLALAVFSIIVATLVLAAAEAADKPLRVWWEALLAGYVSDSTLQKLKPAD